MKKQKNDTQLKIAFLLCILGMIVCLSMFVMAAKKAVSNNEWGSDQQEENTDYINSPEKVHGTENLPEETEEELDYNVEPAINDEMKMLNFTEEEMDAIGDNYNSLSSSIQETLYECGYYGFCYAESKHEMEIDDEAGTVTLYIGVMANKRVFIDAILHKNTSEWQIKIW